MAWREREIQAMGGVAKVLVDGDASLLDLAATTLQRLEYLWSRFRPDSEVSRLNRAGGATMRVAPETVRLLAAMCDAWRATGGAFDPTLLVPLIRLGYGSSWGEPTTTSICFDVSPPFDPDTIELDAPAGTVRLPAGTNIDPGGIGKGLAGDIVAELLIDAGALGALIDVSGDIVVRGAAPYDDGWRLGVGDDADVMIRLHAGGVATSGTERRSWIDRAGRVVHHVLDPTSGEPVDGDVREVTVIAGTGAWAEAWTKAVIVRGMSSTAPILERLGLARRVRRADGSVEHNNAWSLYQVPKETAA